MGCETGDTGQETTQPQALNTMGRQTFKIQTPAGHVTLRDTEALGLSRLDR